ncbi:MAG: hypothetical protein ABI837_09590 [Acidobacteriota bacterium]
MTSENHSLWDADDCEHFHTQNVTSFPAQAHSSEERDVSLAGTTTVKVRASEQGGVSVRGWDRTVARLTVCKYAAGLTQLQAEQSLGSVAVSIHNGEIVAGGPEAKTDGVWWVHMILRLPRRSNLDVTSANGGITIRNMNGRVTARATNGGISLASCAGENRISTGNGGISLQTITGPVDASTENGPISLKLTRDPELPSIEAQIDADSEILCRFKRCSTDLHASRRYLKMGSARPSIRLSSSHAPITIEQVR